MMTAIAGLMQIAAGMRQRDELPGLLARGQAIDPLSWTLHWRYLHVLQPQLGGSVALIRAHLNAIRGAAPDGHLDDLQGFYDYNQGLSACAVNDCEAGIAHFTKALTFGTNPDYLYHRGITRRAIEDFDGARRDLDQALALRPQKANYSSGSC